MNDNFCINTLSNEEWFIEYKAAKDIVSADDSLYAKIKAFKREHKKNLTEHNSDKERELAQLYWNLVIDERAKRFLEAEAKAAEALYDFFMGIIFGIDIDVDFLI